MARSVKGEAHHLVTLPRPVIQPASTATSDQVLCPPGGESFARETSCQGTELRAQVHSRTLIVIIISASFPNIEHLLCALCQVLPWSHIRQNITKNIALQAPACWQQGQCRAAQSFPCLGQRLRTTPKTPEQSVSKGRLCPWVQAPGPWPAMGTVCKQAGSSLVHFISNAVSDGVQPVLPRTLSHAPGALTPEASQGAHSQQPLPPPRAYLVTISKTPRLSLPEPATRP